MDESLENPYGYCENQISSSQLLYKRDVYELVQISRPIVNLFSQVFMGNDDNLTYEPNRKQEPISKGFYDFTEVNYNTCFILRDNNVT